MTIRILRPIRSDNQTAFCVRLINNPLQIYPRLIRVLVVFPRSDPRREAGLDVLTRTSPHHDRAMTMAAREKEEEEEEEEEEKEKKGRKKENRLSLSCGELVACVRPGITALHNAAAIR